MKELIQSINPSYNQNPQTSKPTVLECAMMCRLVYSEIDKISEQLRGSEWQLIANNLVVGVDAGDEGGLTRGWLQYESRKLRVAVFVNSIRKITVIAFKGTEISSLDDLKSDADIFLGKKPRLEKEVKDFLALPPIAKIRAEHKVFLTGHSLGASLAEHISIVEDIPCITFESPGVNFELVDPSKRSNIQSYLTRPNFINCAGVHPGEVRRLDLIFPPTPASQLVTQEVMGRLAKIAWENRDIIINTLSAVVVFGLKSTGLPVPDSVENKLKEFGGKAVNMMERKAGNSSTERAINAFRDTLKTHCLDNIIYTLILMTAPGKIDPENLPIKSTWYNLHEYLFELGIQLHSAQSFGRLYLSKQYYLSFLKNIFLSHLFKDSQSTLKEYFLKQNNGFPGEILEAFSKHQISCIIGFGMAIQAGRIDAGAVVAGEMLCAEYEFLAAQHRDHPCFRKAELHHEVLMSYVALQRQADAWFYGTDAISDESDLMLKIRPSVSPQTMQWPSSLQYQEVPSDGSCLYHAVALYLGKDQAELRRQVAEYLETHKEDFREFVTPSEGRSLENYIQAIREDHEWATHVEIEILMKKLNRPIIVINSDQQIVNVADLKRFPGEPIMVYYNGENHYDALLKVGYLSGREIIAELQRLQQANIARAQSSQKSLIKKEGSRSEVRVKFQPSSMPLKSSSLADTREISDKVSEKGRRRAAIAGTSVGVTTAVIAAAVSFGTGAAAGTVVGLGAGSALTGFLMGVALSSIFKQASEYDLVANNGAEDFVDKKADPDSLLHYVSVASRTQMCVAMGMESGRTSYEEVVQNVVRELGIQEKEFDKRQKEIKDFISRVESQAASGALMALVQALKKSKHVQKDEKYQDTLDKIQQALKLSHDCQRKSGNLQQQVDLLAKEWEEKTEKKYSTPLLSDVIPDDSVCTDGLSLAGGGFGEVYRVKSRFKEYFGESSSSSKNYLHESLNPYNIAVKKYFKDAVTRETLEKRVHKLRLLSFEINYSPFLVRVFGVSDVEEKPAVYMEYLAGGTLHARLYHNDTPLALATKLRWGAEIGLGLAYLHDQQILHEDLRSANVGLTKDEDSAIAKLIDFGFNDIAREIKSTHSQSTQSTSRMPSSVLTPEEWRAPERKIIKGRRLPANKASDVYSYAMMLYELITRVEPFWDVAEKDEIFRGEAGKDARPLLDKEEFLTFNQQLIEQKEELKDDQEEEKHLDNLSIQFERCQKEASGCPSEIVEIVKNAWATEPESRPSAKEISVRLSACYATLYQHRLEEILPQISVSRTDESISAEIGSEILKDIFFPVQLFLHKFHTLRRDVEILKSTPDHQERDLQLSLLESSLSSIGAMLVFAADATLPEIKLDESYRKGFSCK